MPLLRIAPEPAAALALAQLLQGVLAAVCAILVYRTARTALGRLGSTLATLLWIDLTYRFWLSGLELVRADRRQGEDRSIRVYCFRGPPAADAGSQR